MEDGRNVIPDEKREAETAPPQKKGFWQRRKERKRRWKEARRSRRMEQKAFYKDAPWLTKVWNLYLGKPVRGIVKLAILAAVLFYAGNWAYSNLFIPAVKDYYADNKDKPLPDSKKDQIYELSPIDEEGAEKINAIPPAGQDDTWTICVYLVGSDLEDRGEDDLSPLVGLEIQDLSEKIEAARSSKRGASLNRYEQELRENGLGLPEFFYFPEKPVASSQVVTEDVIVAEMPGAASRDIGEMTADAWSEKISIVIQTGGARRWSNQMVNPNRTQRFVYRNGQMEEVESLPLQPVSEADTLADFLEFCRDGYPSDHTMLVLWDHGSGPFGFGHDSICGGMFTLKDIRSALERVYDPSDTDPAFDIIGFDACLMSTLEVTHALDGFADYYALSEEAVPGDGWYYTPVLQAMSEDPSMSPAQVARVIADSYTDFYMTENVNIPPILQEVTFSVLDARKSEELYDAYCALAEAQLRDAAEDISVLAEVGRCGSRATRFCQNDYNIVNTVDLGNYTDYMAETYPDECGRIKELLKEAVLYHRQNGSLSDAEGIAVYLPSAVDTAMGLAYYLDYVYNVCEDDGIRALYYYKQSGCLNEEMEEYTAGLTDAKPRVLDTSLFKAFGKSDPEIGDYGFLIPIDETLQSMIADFALEVGAFDEANNTLRYYGTDEDLYPDGEGNLCSDYDGTWICLEGEPLAVEVISSTPSSVEYRSHVLYQGKDAYLTFSFDREAEAYSITGIRMVQNDGPNYLVNTKANMIPEIGSKITPLYEAVDFSADTSGYERGNAVRFSSRTAITRDPLPKGYYLATAVIGDPRGDKYYSAVIGHTVSGGKVTQREVDERFYGRGY